MEPSKQAFRRLTIATELQCFQRQRRKQGWNRDNTIVILGVQSSLVWIHNITYGVLLATYFSQSHNLENSRHCLFTCKVKPKLQNYYNKKEKRERK